MNVKVLPAVAKSPSSVSSVPECLIKLYFLLKRYLLPEESLSSLSSGSSPHKYSSTKSKRAEPSELPRSSRPSRASRLIA